MKRQQFVGSLLALLGGMMWGISGTIGQFMFTQKGLSSLWLTPIRLFLSGVILLLWYALRHPKQLLAPWKDPTDRRDILIYGLLGISLCQLLYFGTIQLSSAGVATILQDLSPIMILGCTCVAARRLPFWNEVFSIVLAFVGVLLIVTHGDFTNLAVSPSALLIGIACAGTVTIYNVFPKRLLARHPIPLLQGWSFLMGGILYLLLFHPWTYHVEIDWQILAGIAGVVIIGNLLAFNLYMKGVALIGADKACLYGFSEPVAAAFLSSVWLGAPFTLWDGVGFACVFAMLVMLSLGQLRHS